MADLAEHSIIAKVVTELRGEQGTVHRREGTWLDSGSICCLADAERHLGHIVKAGSYWLAFDATRSNESGTWFRFLGVCVGISAAKRVVELGHPMGRECSSTLQ
jgi:hypothetical protein